MMRYIIDVEIPTDKLALAETFLKMISFVKQVRAVENNEIRNPVILQSIEAYESGKTKPTPINLAELKLMINT